MGYAMRAERTLLADFVKFLVHRGEINPIRAQAALDWASQSAHKRGSSGTASRLVMARRFLLHLRASYPETEIPAHGLVAAARRPTPFLFTDNQIEQLVAAARTSGPRGSLRPYTLSTFLGLLASTGLRVGEAVRLTVTDVRLSVAPARLLIRETKFGKSRWVPLHSSTADRLAEYFAKRKELSYDGVAEAFFISERGGPLRVSGLDRWFGKLVLQEGLWPDRGKRWPSLRSFRHTFAVGRLRAWYEEGADVSALVPQLAVYLGHVCPQETYWYLTATPELLGEAAKRFALYISRGEER
jgi:integrase/recombinase XerD